MLQCDAPVTLAGDSRLVQVKELDLFFSRETTVHLRYFPRPFVFKVEPSTALRTHSGTTIKVHVSNWHAVSHQAEHVRYCKFGSYVV